MFRNYIKIALRNLLKNKSTFAINILGLGVGIASCLLILLFVTDELSYDSFHEKSDQIVRVVFKAKINNEDIKEAVVMAPVAQTLKNDFPEVLDAARLRNRGLQNIATQNKVYRKARFAYVDANFFNIFTLPISKGNTISPLKEPFSIVISEKEAENYFGNSALAIGKQLYLDGSEDVYTITAVMENIPKNSHFNFDLLASMQGHTPSNSTSWTDSGFHTYLLLRPEYNYLELEAKLPTILEKYMGSQLQEALGVSYKDFTKENQLGLYLQPLSQIHLNSDFSAASQMKEGGNKKYIYIFGAVSLFMLLIACINFTNLSTATASKRSKEVGIKKVLGSGKYQLRFQFLVESLLATAIALTLALVFLILFLPLFNELSGKELELSYLMQPTIALFLIGLLIIISLLAGLYPAFFLSSFQPLDALRSKFYGKRNSKGIRSSLVVFQFIVATVLIFATLIVKQQMTFIQNKELGYNKEELLIIRNTNALKGHEISFLNELKEDTRVLSLSKASHVPAGSVNDDMSGVFVNNKFQRRVFVYHIDEHYIPTLGMTLQAGRNFSQDFGSDSTKIIINESAAKALGFEEDPIGKTLETNSPFGRKLRTVIGVVKDFHFKSLHQSIEPLIFDYSQGNTIIIKAKTQEMAGLIQIASEKWDKLQLTQPFYYTLLDEDYNQTYLAERKIGKILSIFALLTIFVACLGLLGLITFTAERRFKEIGIRKVLGSNRIQIIRMLSQDLLKLVSISFLIAFPLAYFLMNIWLQDFAYRIQIQWWVFVLAGCITITIAFATISWRSFKAASQNPAKSLQTE